MSNDKEVVQMPKPCVDCGAEWSMSNTEKRFYERKMEEMNRQGKEFSMPKRCAPCRKKRRSSKKNSENKTTIEQIISRIDAMARKAFEGLYTFDDEILANDLEEVSRELKRMFPKRSRNEETQAEGVGQSTQGGSLQA